MDVGPERHIVGNARHGEVELVVYGDDLADGVLVAKILPGRRFGDHHGERLPQGCFGIALDEGKGEHIKERRVSQEEARFCILRRTIPNQTLLFSKADGLFDLGKIGFE